MDERFHHRLACPRDHLSLEFAGDRLVCAGRHEYPVVDGVPVMLLQEVQQTLAVGNASLQATSGGTAPDSWFIDSLGCSEEERSEIREILAKGESFGVDPVV